VEAVQNPMLRIAGTIVILLLVLLLFVAWLGSSDPTRAEHAFPTAIQVGFLRICTFIRNFREEIVAVGTLFIAIFTVILAFATGFLYFATRDLVKGSDKTARQQLRAYVYVQPGNVYLVSAGLKPQPRIVVRNSGQTFAKDVKCSYGAKVSSNLSVEESAALGPGTPEEGRFTLNPGVDHAIIKWMPDAITADEARSIKTLTGDVRLYVFGKIDYNDVFGDAHHTEFCFMYYGEMQNWPNNGGEGFNSTQARYCENHNDAD